MLIFSGAGSIKHDPEVPIRYLVPLIAEENTREATFPQRRNINELSINRSNPSRQIFS